MGHLFYIILYQPILNALVVLYNIVPGRDLGVSILLLTLLIKLVLYPLTARSLKVQRQMQLLQPKINELRAVRGTRSIYHNNAIQSWQVAQSGEVSNVQVY